MTKDLSYYDRVLGGLQRAAELSRAETDPEKAVSHFSRITREVLGDPDGPSRPGALKPGETQFSCSCIFFIAPTRDHMVMCADHGFPAEQRHAQIPSNYSRPGHAIQTRTPAVVGNTDEDTIFRQILATGRVGCSIYVPVMWRDEVIGVFNTACKARYMFDETDMRMQMLYANLAGATWMALGGPAYLADLIGKLKPWAAA